MSHNPQPKETWPKLPPETLARIEREAGAAGDRAYNLTPGFPSEKEWPALLVHKAHKNAALAEAERALELVEAVAEYLQFKDDYAAGRCPDGYLICVKYRDTLEKQMREALARYRSGGEK